jgi:hypothetical protein
MMANTKMIQPYGAADSFEIAASEACEISGHSPISNDSACQSITSGQIYDPAFGPFAAIKIFCQAASRYLGPDVSELFAGYSKDFDRVRINGVIRLALQDQFFAYPTSGYEVLAGLAVFIAMRHSRDFGEEGRT